MFVLAVAIFAKSDKLEAIANFKASAASALDFSVAILPSKTDSAVVALVTSAEIEFCNAVSAFVALVISEDKSIFNWPSAANALALSVETNPETSV